MADEPREIDAREFAQREQRRAEATARRARAAQLKVDVFALRRGGASYREIARQLSITPSRAHQIVSDELRRLSEQLTHSREQLRALELERVDKLLVKLDGLLREGRRVEKTKTGETVVVMTRPGVGYFFAYMRALERRAKLLGLDAPIKLEVDTPKPERELPADALDEQIAELQQQIADAEARVGRSTKSVH